MHREGVPSRQNARRPRISFFGLLGALERSTSKCLLEAMEPRIQLLASRPPIESADDVRQSRLLDRIQKNTMLYSDGALAWPKVSKDMRKAFGSSR